MSKFADDHPRRLHYVFAHQFVRMLVWKHRGDLHRIVRRGGFDVFLKGAWDQMAKDIDAPEPAPELAVTLEAVAEIELLVISFPRPEHTTEAYFAAITNPGKPKDVPRYFVLEHGWDLDDSPRTVLCEWTERGHVNLGDGPSPDRDQFVMAVASHLGKRRQ